MKNNSTDKFTVFSVLLAIAVITIPMVLFPGQAETFIRETYQNIVNVFGSTYMVFTLLTVIFMISLCMTKYGGYRLGGEDSTPEYTNLSWSSMLFCSGIGGGILYWGVVEWAYYVDQSLFGIEAYSERAYHLASAYGMFHWGLSGWALYLIPTITIAVPYYHYKLGSLRLSSGLRTNSNVSVEHSVIGRSVDFIFVLVLIGASGGTLGMYVPVIGAGVSELFNLEHNLMLDLSMLALCTMLFGYSVYKGIYNGIRLISNINVIMALTFLMFILILGPTKEILILTYSAFKELAINFAGMNTLGIIEKSKFADDWSIFYWAWWLALGPQVGLFVARVSKGRSLREVILGMLILGSLGCTLFFAIMGNYAINLELSGQMEVSSILANEGHQVAATKVILSLPFGKVFLFTYCLIVVIFIATSYDSVSYILASHIRKTGINYSEPTRSNRLFWAFVLAIIPACLFIIGSNRTAMDLILLMSPPILILSPIFVFSMVKTLRNHYH